MENNLLGTNGARRDAGDHSLETGQTPLSSKPAAPVVTPCTCKDVEIGSYKNQVEVPIPDHMKSYGDARVKAGLSDTVCIDRCILEEIHFLWSHGVRTYGSCCGHKKTPAMVNVHARDYQLMLDLGYQRMITDPEHCQNTFFLKSGTQKHEVMAPLPTKHENPKGLHQKYFISRTDGQPVSELAEFFVLRLDRGASLAHREASLKAIEVYAESIEDEIPLLAQDLRKRYLSQS